MNYPGFVGSSGRAQSPIADQEDLTNWYEERSESQFAPTKSALYPCPGVEALPLTLGGASYTPPGAGRASFFEPNTERWFVVIGAQFLEISSSFAVTIHGAVTDDGLPANIISNGDVGQLVITAGGNGYLFVLATNTLTAIAALAGIADQAVYMDGFGIVLDIATSTMYQSDLLDFATWDPTNFIQRSDQGDPWISLKAATPYVWALGKWTGIAYYDAGLSPIAFLPHPSGKINFGSGASFSAAVVDGSLVWLAATVNGQGQVIRLAGFTPEVISTFALENDLAQYARIDDAIGDSYSQLGHSFFNLTFVSGTVTWSWDAQGQKWHKRRKWNSSMSAFEAARPLFHAFAYGKHTMLDRTNGSVYLYGPEFGSDVDGDPIVRERVPPALVMEMKWLYMARLEVWLETGLGLSTGQGSNPRVMLQMSRDGGKTWGTELSCGAGRQGEYNTRVFWNRLGNGRMLVPRIRVSDPIPWRILGAFVEVEKEAA